MTIASLMPNLIGRDDGEWIELIASGQDRDLIGCVLVTGRKKYTFKESFILSDEIPYRFSGEQVTL